MEAARFGRRAGIAILAVAMLAGCQSDKLHEWMRADPQPISDFLPHHEWLLRQPDTFPFHYFYLSPKIADYDNIYIAPVDTRCLRDSDGWAEFDAALAGSLGADVDDLCVYMRKAYKLAFMRQTGRKALKVVDRRDLPKTLSLELALISIVPTKAELYTAGQVGSLVIPGLGLVTSYASSGSVTIECCIRDAKDGRVLAMYADTEVDPSALIDLAKLTWTYSAMVNIKEMAGHTATVLAAKDYRKIRRDFPFSFISTISDAELGEEKADVKEKEKGKGKSEESESLSDGQEER